ncbi:MAG: SH3 domain-containing protein, partial [Anaerolineae bacterium]|nr:SH3 domain-containing protein [Anaerolineae bacterium]
MKLRLSQMIFNLAGLGLFVGACNSPAPPATPDLVATQVAVEKAAAATLTAEAVASQPAASTFTPTPGEANPTSIPPTATPVPQTTGDTLAQPTPTSTGTPVPACTVVAASLNVRPGPGVAYTPPLTTLAQGATLTPIGFSAVGYPGGQWVQIQTPDGQTGWVSTDPQFVSCNIDPATLPPVSVPPPPTPTPTSTPIPAQPTPTPSPTPEQLAFFEPPGGG